MKSWKSRCRSYREPAIVAVRRIVAALRQRGAKTEYALDDAARTLGITRRRARTLFYTDGEPIVLQDEWDAMRMRAASFLRREADSLRERAEILEAQADELENQPSLFEWGAGQKWSGSGFGAQAQRRAV